MDPRRAIGIIRVSQVSGRSGESFSSPTDQRSLIEKLAAEQGWELEVYEPELNISGDAQLEQRPSLSRAVMAVQTGSAQVIAAAHVERLWWNHETAGQVIRLVEEANGEVWSADVGLLTRRSAADEFSGTVRTAADRLVRKQNAEKSEAAVIRAVARGVLPYGSVPPGLRRREDRTLEPDENAPTVRAAYQLRADGATIREVRAFLAKHGIQRSYHGVQSLLTSRVLLGEIHFGKLTNLAAHEPVVDADLWRRVQQSYVSRGRRAKSDRLLARLGVLRCGSCSSRLVVGSSHHGAYPIYRCPPVGDCKARVAISATKVEQVVEDAVREAIADVRGQATVETDALQAQARADHAQSLLDAALRAFDGLEDETAARERLTALRQARDTSRAEADRLGSQRAALTLSGVEWDRLTLSEHRALVRAVVESVTVAPGRGAGRISLKLLGQ